MTQAISPIFLKGVGFCAQAMFFHVLDETLNLRGYLLSFKLAKTCLHGNCIPKNNGPVLLLQIILRH